MSIIPIALASIPEQTMVSAATSFVNGLISPMIIVGAIVGIIGFAMLLVKLAFKKQEDAVTTK
jgi:mannose/fructose/N-acetylgalactosamine-specific phosphotransferase system component IIC